MKMKIAACLLALASCGAFAQATIKGAGVSSFPFGSIAYWAMMNMSSTQKTTMTYQPMGVPSGIEAMSKGAFDFVVADVPLTADELQKMDLIQAPIYVSGVVLVHNLKGVKELKLNAETIARIYSGSIINWDDASIRSLNKGLTSVGSIKPIVRVEDGGVSDVFRAYMLKNGGEWAKAFADKAVWPAHVVTKTPAEAGAFFAATPGALAFVPYGVALKEQLQIVQIPNKAGRHMEPKTTALSAVSSVIQFSEKPSDSFDLGGDDSWPIANFGWLVVKKKSIDGSRARRVMSFFFNAMKDANSLTGDGVVSISDRIKSKSIARFGTVTDQTGKPIDFLNF